MKKTTSLFFRFFLVVFFHPPWLWAESLEPNRDDSARPSKNASGAILEKTRGQEWMGKPETGNDVGRNVEFQVLATGSFLNNEKDGALWPQGFGLGAWSGYHLNKEWTIGLRLDYFDFPVNSKELADRYLGDYSYAEFTGTAALHITRFIPCLKINLISDSNEALQPYFITGYGFMNESFDSTSISGLDPSGNPIPTVGLPAYSKNMDVVLIGIGLPLRISPEFNIPIEATFSTGFVSPENVGQNSLALGIEREW